VDSVTITINGLVASGRDGMTILELAREMGISIPTLCYDPDLSPAGACRICLVEEEKTGALLASCVTPITPGMVIQTDSPRVRENRKMIIKLMLASHPESCLLCEKGNRCRLRQIAAELNIGFLDLYKLPNYTGIQELNPFIQRDLSKCILCGKCLRADQELVVVGAIDYFQRGFAAKPATWGDQPLEASPCTFCGTCVSICPTGALSEKGKPALSSPITSVSSICPYCACGCGLSLKTAAFGVVAVEPDREKRTVNQAALCARGHYGWDFISHKERLTSPLLRQGDNWRKCSWAEALDFATATLNKVCQEHGPEALAFLGSSKCTNEENYLFQKLARVGIGTNNIDNGSRLWGPPAAQVWGAPWGWGAMTNPIADLEEARGLLVIGANPDETAPLVAYKIKRAVRFHQAKLVLVDPRGTRLASFAQPWLQLRPGSDGFLLLGFLRVILEEGLGEKKIIETNQAELAELQEAGQVISWNQIVQETGIELPLLKECARQLAREKPLAIILGDGLWQEGWEHFNLAALINFSILTGNLWVKGGGIYPLGKENNAQGARDMGVLPEFLPGYQSFLDEEVREKFAQAWGKSLPKQKGWNAWQMIAKANEGKIKGMYIMGENPLRSFPDQQFVQNSLAKLNLLIVQDLFFTETARLAHVIFPAASFAEKEGTFTNAERRVQLLEPAVLPPGESWPDWKILTELLTRFTGAPAYATPAEILQEINGLVPFYGGIKKERLKQESLFWPCFNAADQGQPRYKGQNVLSISPLIKKIMEIKERKKEAQNSFLLIWGTPLFYFGGGTRSEKSRRLRKIMPPPSLHINPQEAVKRGWTEGSKVKISGGSKEAILPLSFNKEIPPGTVFWPLTPGETNPHNLLDFPEGWPGYFPYPRSRRVSLERI